MSLSFGMLAALEFSGQMQKLSHYPKAAYMYVTKGMENIFEESLRQTYQGHYLEKQTPVASESE